MERFDRLALSCLWSLPREILVHLIEMLWTVGNLLILGTQSHHQRFMQCRHDLARITTFRFGQLSKTLRLVVTIKRYAVERAVATDYYRCG